MYTVKKICKFCYSCLVEKLLFLQVKHFTGICSKCCEFYYFCQVNSLPACKQRGFSGNSSKLGKIYMYCLARKNTRLHVDFTYFSEKLCFAGKLLYQSFIKYYCLWLVKNFPPSLVKFTVTGKQLMYYSCR